MNNICEKMKQLLDSSTGQISIGTLISVFIVIVLFAALSPTLNYFVCYAISSFGSNSTASTIISLWPLGMAIAILWGIFIYAKPYYERLTG